jgi:hypothetical protein
MKIAVVFFIGCASVASRTKKSFLTEGDHRRHVERPGISFPTAQAQVTARLGDVGLIPLAQPWFRFNVAYSDMPELFAFFRKVNRRSSSRP